MSNLPKDYVLKTNYPWDDPKVASAANFWLSRHHTYPPVFVGRNTAYHLDDVKAFLAQYQPDRFNMDKFKQAIIKHAPNKRKIMAAAGYNANSATNFKYYMNKYPELLDLYNKQSDIVAKQKAITHDKNLQLTKESLNCETYSDALAFTGLKKAQYDKLFFSIYNEKAHAYFKKKHRLEVVRNSKNLKIAAIKLNLSVSGLEKYLKRIKND